MNTVLEQSMHVDVTPPTTQSNITSLAPKHGYMKRKVPSLANFCSTLVKLRHRQLQRQTHRQLRMLLHVVKTQLLNLILNGVDLVIT